jgi:DNA-binding NarL/FixJ family response regulator
VITDIKSISPNIAVLVSCNNSDKLMELNTLKAGGHALLPKTVSRSDFFGIMDVVSKRRVSLSSEMFQELFQNVAASHKEKDEYVSLTDREAGIARLLVQGLSVKHIATSLGVSSPSVSNHKTKIFKKLNVSNIIELSAYLAPATKE